MAAGRLLLGVVTITLLVIFTPSRTKALFENCTDDTNCTQANTVCNGSQCVCEESSYYTFDNSDCYPYCPVLNNPANGVVSDDNRTYQGTATYTCNSGYVIDGMNNADQLTATCGSNGIWSPSSASCVKRDCGTPDSLNNGKVSAPNTTFEATGTYTCDPGYIVSGENTTTLNVTCTENGTWSEAPPTCIKRDCGRPNNTNNGNVSAPNTTFEATGTYTCDPGYIVSGENTTTLNVTCTENGTWSEAPPTCTRRDCGTPNYTSNGNFSAPNTTFEATGTFTCDPGYIVSGENTTTLNVTCTENGTWSEAPPTCIKRECGTPNNTSNGNFSAPNTSFEATGTYTCNPGYIVSGKNTTTLNVTCTENGTWSEAPPTCTRRDCGSPNNTDNGNVSAPNTTFEATGTYTCDTGYIVSGRNTTTLNVTCTENGTWSEAPPTCIKRDCGSPNNTNNGNVSAPNTTFEATGTYTCDTGYIVGGTNTTTFNVTCTENGTWSEVPPTCTKRDCGSLANITDGTVAAPVTTYEATANYTCNDGYVINGTSSTVLTVTCASNGSWSQASPTCERRDCGSLNNINNGNVSAPNTTFEATGTYTCDTGYIVSGRNTTTLNVTCTENGTWSEFPPTCTKRDCGSLANITDGTVAAPVTTYEATANYTCNDGYVINGTNSTVLTVTCDFNGSWSQVSPTCERRDCGSLANITDGTVAAPVTTYEATANYTCNDGYVINGTNSTVLTVTCAFDGSWSQASPTCKRRDCGPLYNISNGIVAVPATTFEAIATYTCDTGYVINNTDISVRNVTCKANGNWSESPPICVKRDCGGLTDNINNGMVVGTDTTFQATANYTCNPGYVIDGTNETVRTVTCEASGSWSQGPPTCVKRDCGGLTNNNDGVVVVSDTTFQATANYTCNPGYVIDGTNETVRIVTCEASGSWSQGPPTCLRRDCGQPPDLANGMVDSPSTTFEATATYTCDTGYIITGADSATLVIQCTAAGSWNVTNPTCSIKGEELGETCPNPNTTNLQPEQLCTRTNAACLISTDSDFKCQCNIMFYDGNGENAGGTCKSVTELNVIGITFPSVSTTSMLVNWTPPAGKQSFVDGYHVQWMEKINSSQTGRSEFLSSTTLQFNISSNVTSGRAYRVRVITRSQVSYSPTLKTTSVEKEQALKPQTPGSIISESSDLDAEDKSINVTWTANGYASRYEIKLLEGNTTPTSSSTNSAVISFTDFKNGHKYNVSITAISEEFEGGQVVKSETFTEEIKTVVKVPSPPRSVRCHMTTDTTVTIQWTAPEMPNGDLVEYIVETYLLHVTQKIKSDRTNSTAEMFEVTGLLPGQYYIFSVLAVNENFTSMPAQLEGPYCATRANMSEIPNNFRIPTIESRSFDVTWTRPNETFGENFGYVLQVRNSQDQCVMELIRNCTDCTETFNRTTLENMCDASVSIVQGVSKTDIESDAMQKYTVKGSSILPDTSYKVSVSAINAAGRGNVASTTISTKEEAPQKPSNVQISDLTATSCNVTWDIGDPRPGNTTFEVIITAAEPVIVNPYQLTGFDKRSQAVSGLEEYWNYTVIVNATTSIGSNVSDPTQFTTLPAAPGPVDSFDIVRSPEGNYTQILLQWKLPVLRQRNGEIVRFVLQHNTSKSMNVGPVEEVRVADSEYLYEVRLGVTPEVTYQFTVYAVNKENQTGEESVTTIRTPAGTPRNDFEVAENRKVIETESVILTQNTIKVSIATEFFEQDVYGNIVTTGLIGCAVLKCGNVTGNSISLAVYNSYQNWHSASQDGYTPYRITSPVWRNNQSSQNTRKRRNTEPTEDFIVGSQTCNATNSNEYCNGPLQPSTSYIIHAVVCTNGGCLISKEYGPFITLAVPPNGEDNTVTIIVAVVVSVVIVALIVGGVIIFLKKRRYQPKMSKMTDEVNTLEVPPSPNIQKKRPVKLSQFENHLASLHKDSNLQFSADYEDLRSVSPSYPQNAANLEENRLKNRYINILPFDHSRVKLFSNGDEDSSDYINANYLPGYRSPREYIGCQGPIPGTIDDFWRMVWEQNVSIIVMLTLCKEGQKVKCEQYWPDETGEPKQYGDVVVEVMSNSTIQTYIMRIFKITNGNKSRTVKHFHFLSWLDFQANVKHDIILDFITHVRSHVQPPDTAGPMIIHCSAGVGRTGTYICLDHLMQYIEEHDFDVSVDIFDMVLKLRENRPLMVQTEQQYVFIHDCVKELMDRKRRQMDNIYENQGFCGDENIYQNTEPTLYENVQMKTEL